MVLRVQMLYHRSRFKILILGTLFTLYTLEVVWFLVYCVTVSAGSVGSGSAGELNDIMRCMISWMPTRVDSGHWQSASIFVLLVDRLFQCSLAESFGCCSPDQPWYIDVSSHNHSIYQGVAPTNEDGKMFPTQPIHKTPCEGWHSLLYCVS